MGIFLKEIMTKFFDFENVSNTVNSLKFSPDTLQSIVNKKILLPPIFKRMKTLKIGNVGAKAQILIVLNPFEFTSRLLFHQIKKLLDNTNEFSCEFLIDVSKQDRGTVEKLMFSENLENQMLDNFEKLISMKKALLENHPLITENEQVSFHSIWIELANIISLPKIYFNDSEIPNYYYIHEIPKLLRLLLARTKEYNEL